MRRGHLFCEAEIRSQVPNPSSCYKEVIVNKKSLLEILSAFQTQLDLLSLPPLQRKTAQAQWLEHCYGCTCTNIIYPRTTMTLHMFTRKPIKEFLRFLQINNSSKYSEKLEL